jgi:predicted phage tail protein
MHEIGHILDEQYGLRGMVKEKKFKTELRALADLRHEGETVTPSRRRYERKGEEKIANLVHAFLYAPERAKQVAPNSYWALWNLAKKTPDLKPLLTLQKTRSLKLGVMRHEIQLGGFPELGYYAMPDDAARVFNNHLSRGLAGRSAIYDAYRWLNNSMVTGQLALSGLFHATFTGLNALTSEGGLALQELVRAAETGDWNMAAKGLARAGAVGALGTAGAAVGFALGGPAGMLWATGYPIAALKFAKGWRGRRAWLTEDPAGRFLGDHVRTMQEGGFRPTWDSFYDNGAMKNAIRALRSGNYPGALARAVPAALDLLSRPIMGFMVPALKTAAYLDAAGFELDRLKTEVANVTEAEQALAQMPQTPQERKQLTPEERQTIKALEQQRADNLAVIREALNRVQASMDNRFGEVVYDNWFWQRWLKDLTHVILRSPGWQAGTYKEVLGAPIAQAKRLLPGGRGGTSETGTREDLLAGSMAWLLAVIGITMLLGGLSHYMSTHERPHGRDWFYPKGEDGQRRSLPTYLRTIVSAYLHPIRTIGGISAPLNAMLWRIFVSNETFSGEMIREPGDPFFKQAWDALRLVAKEGYQPFVGSNIARGLGKTESLMGVSPAPAEIQRSAAENYLHDILPQQPARTHEEQAKLEARRALRLALENQDPEAAKKAIRDGGLTRGSVKAQSRIAARQVTGQSSVVPLFQRATLEQGLHAYELATPDERAELKAPLVKKWHNLLPSVPVDQRRAMYARFKAALALETTKPAKASGQ